MASHSCNTVGFMMDALKWKMIRVNAGEPEILPFVFPHYSSSMCRPPQRNLSCDGSAEKKNKKIRGTHTLIAMQWVWFLFHLLRSWKLLLPKKKKKKAWHITLDDIMLPNVFNFIFLVLWKHLHCVQLSQKGGHIKKKKKPTKLSSRLLEVNLPMCLNGLNKSFHVIFNVF